MLQSNAERVKGITADDIWRFSMAQILIGFGLGALAARYCPSAVASTHGVSELGLGILFLVIAAIGLFRKKEKAG
jgi:hypothetical protein